MTHQPIHSKITIIGSPQTGKSSMILSYQKVPFSSHYSPTSFTNLEIIKEYKKKEIHLDLWDTAGQEDYKRLIPLAYPDTNLVLVCFAVNSVGSFEAVRQIWIPEIKFHCRGVPYYLIGCKQDLRLNNDESVEHECVSQGMGKEMAKEIGALGYFECSARDGTGVNEVFDGVLRWVYRDYKKRNRFRWVKGCWGAVKDFFD